MLCGGLYDGVRHLRMTITIIIYDYYFCYSVLAVGAGKVLAPGQRITITIIIPDYYFCYSVLREGLRTRTDSIEGVRARWCQNARGIRAREARGKFVRARADLKRLAFHSASEWYLSKETLLQYPRQPWICPKCARRRTAR